MKTTFRIILCTLLLCAMVPAAAMAAAPAVIIEIDDSHSFAMQDGYCATNAGSYRMGPPASGQTGYAWYRNGVLTLNHFEARMIDIAHNDAETANLTIVLQGSSSLTNDSGDAFAAENTHVLIRGEGAALSLTATASGDGALDIKAGDLTITGGTYNLTTYDEDGIEAKDAQVLIEDAVMTILLTCAEPDTEEGIDVEGGRDLMIRRSSLAVTADDAGISTSDNGKQGGNIIIEDSRLHITSRTGRAISSDTDLIISGSTIAAKGTYNALHAGGSMRLLNGRYDLAANEGCLAVAAGGGLDAYGQTVLQNIEDVHLGKQVFTLGDANGPFSRCSFTTVTHAVPRTGDSTPVVLLMAALLLSLSAVFMLRRRMA